MLAVCRLSDDTVKFNEGLKRRETVTGPCLEEDMENPGDGVLAVAYLGGGIPPENRAVVVVYGRIVVLREVIDICVTGDGVWW